MKPAGGGSIRNEEEREREERHGGGRGDRTQETRYGDEGEIRGDSETLTPGDS